MKPRRPAWLRWRRLATLAWPGHPERWRDVPGRLRPTLVSTLRLTCGAIVAYLCSLVTSGGVVDLTGALTALLVMQASAYSTLKMGAVRVGAVLGGVLIASLLSTWIGLTWWSLGAVIALALLLAKVLRLGEQALETPISAMLILGVSNAALAAETRVVNTLIGAGVGVAFNLIYPPAMPTRPANRAILGVAESIAASLDDASRAFTEGPVNRGQVRQWADAVRLADRRVDRASTVVASVKDSRVFNPRALGTLDVEPVMASGLARLEGCLLAIRSLYAVLLAELPTDEQPGDVYGEELRSAFAVVLRDVAHCIRGFGTLVVAEVDGHEQEAERALDSSLDLLRETQAILTELMITDAQDNRAAWLLHGSTLSAVKHVLDQLDLEERSRARLSWREEQSAKPLAHLPPLVQAALPHPDLPILRGLAPDSEWWTLVRRGPEPEPPPAGHGPRHDGPAGDGPPTGAGPPPESPGGRPGPPRGEPPGRDRRPDQRGPAR